jgi:hypothetical protein
MGACAALSGLDQIGESSCAPLCGDEAGLDANVAPVDGSRSLEAAPAPDGATAPADAPEGSLGDGGADSRAVTPDGNGDGSVEAAEGDSPSDGSSWAVDGREDGPGVADASPPSDSGCGTVYLRDPFTSASSGWTLDTSWSVASTCAQPPAPQKGNPDPTVDHTTGAAGGVLAAYACGNNPADEASAFRYATSAAVDVSAAPAVFVTFYRWLNSDESTYMVSTVDVFDGTQWVNMYSSSTTLVTDAAWTKEQYDVTAQKNTALRVRFGYEVLGTKAYAMSCWNVDDLTVSSAACP